MPDVIVKLYIGRSDEVKMQLATIWNFCKEYHLKFGQRPLLFGQNAPIAADR